MKRVCLFLLVFSMLFSVVSVPVAADDIDELQSGLADVFEEVSEPSVVDANIVNQWIDGKYDEYYEDEYSGFSDYGIAVLAAEVPDGDTSWYNISGTEFVITNQEQLIGLASLVNSGESFAGKTIILGNDIECTKTFAGIGTSEACAFAGTFDGAGFEISNVYMYSDNITVMSAPFGYISEGAVIKDVTFSGEIEAPKCTLVGKNYGTVDNVKSEIRFKADGMVSGICLTNVGSVSNCTFSGSLDNIMNDVPSSMIVIEPISSGIVAANTGSVINCVNYSDINSKASYVGGIIAYNGSSEAPETVVSGCINYGDIIGRGYVGGAVGSSVTSVTDCVNYGNVTASSSYVSGVVTVCKGSVMGCKNYGAVTGVSSYNGGVVSYCTGDISECVNYGTVIGGSCTGGVIGYNTGAIEYCVNTGNVTGNSTFAGGISARSTTGDIIGCLNYGDVFGDAAVGEQAGGIVAKNEGSKIESCGNFGNITYVGTVGGIVGLNLTKNAEILDCFSIGDISGTKLFGNIIGNAQGYVKYSYTVGSPNNIAGYVPGANKISNKCYADLSSSELTNGTLLNTINSGGEVWTQGVKYPYLEAFGDIGLNVTTEQELIDALSKGDNVTLGDNIILTAPLSIIGTKNINGNGFRITGSITGGGGSITINNAIIDGNGGTAVAAADGEVVIDSVRFVNCGSACVSIKGGSIEVSQISLDDENVPLVSAQDGAVVIGRDNYYSQTIDGITEVYLKNINPLWDENTATEIIIPASLNDGVSFDIKPYPSDDVYYFMMPADADLSNITCQALNSSGDVIDTFSLSSEQNGIASVTVKGLEYTIKAMQADLPTVYLNIDEDKGAISDMNNSQDHSALCYGSVQIDVPYEMAVNENNGITSYFDDGMEMRGRGNLTWRNSINISAQKPYQFKLGSKLDLFGMGKAKTWTLLGTTYTQNVYYNKLVYDMSYDMGLENSSQSRFVMVYMNGEFLGMYTLAEKVQVGEARVNISDLEDEVDDVLADGGDIDSLDLTGGYLCEIDNSNDDLQFKTNNTKITIQSPTNLDVAPNFGDTESLSNNRYKYIVDTVSYLFDAIFNSDNGIIAGGENAGKHFTEVIDMESFITYFWSQELSSNIDCTVGSTYFYKDKDSIDPKIYLGPVWDCDGCFNAEYGTAWIMPTKTNSDGTARLFNALCQHREFVSYAIAYYKNDYNNIASVYKSYADLSLYYDTLLADARSMSLVRWPWKYTYANGKTANYIKSKAAWVDEYLEDPDIGLMQFATKGNYIPLEEVPAPEEDTDSAPTEEPVPEATAAPTSEPIDETGLVTYFNFENGTAAEDLDGDYEMGYDSRQGIPSKLFASVDGENLRKMKWSSELYGDSVVPIVEPNSTTPWGENPYFEIQTSTVGFDTITVSAELGGTKKGAANFDIRYSTDGVNFTTAAEGATITKNKTMVQVFDNVELPGDAGNCETLYIRFVPRNGETIGGEINFIGNTGGEFAINNIIIRGSDEPLPTAEPTPTPTAEPNYSWLIDSYDGNVVTVTTPDDAAAGETYFVFIAKYSDAEIMTDCEVITLTVESGKTSYELAAEKKIGGENIKVMLWDKDLKPLTAVFER